MHRKLLCGPSGLQKRDPSFSPGVTGPPGDIWQRLDTFLVVSSERVLLAFSRQRPEVLLVAYSEDSSCPNREFCGSRVFLVLKVRDPELDLHLMRCWTLAEPHTPPHLKTWGQ